MRLFCFLLLVATDLHAQSKAPAIDSIRRDEMRADLFFLASDAMRGRLTNTPEYALAAEWIASRFARLGLEPLNKDGTFFQPFDLVYARLGETNKLEIGKTAEARRAARLGEEYYPLSFSASGAVRGSAVLVGYGIQAAEHSWDDYRGRDVSGKVVILFDGDPAPEDPKSPFDGLVTSEYASGVRKVLTAQQQGAAAVLIVSNRREREGPRSFAASGPNYWPKDPPRIERYQLAGLADRVRIPALQISQPLAEHILSQEIDALRTAADKSSASVFTPAPLNLDLTASVSRTVVTDRNIVAKLEGGDPQLKNEAVLVTAHHDHDGAEGPRILAGADDNGSGTIGVLEIAEAYATAARAGQRPKRTIIFALWGSEERGLLGSWAWVDSPLWPLDKTAASLNMDMIGRNEEVPEGGGRRFFGLKTQPASANANAVHVMGYSFNPELAEMVRQANRDIDLTLRMDYDNNRSNLVRRSDQWPFLQRRVPSVFFHTGLHPDYHTPGDRPERIEYAKMERIVRLVYQTSWDVANAAKRPSVPAKRVIPDAN